MPRVHRIIAPGIPHHITQRGNYGQLVFHRDGDRHLYLQLLEEFLPHYGVRLEAYCLMSNHVHLIATPHEAKGLSRALQRIHSDYSRHLHLRLRQSGHLWQARFYSVALDEEHFWAAMLYVEKNPVRAGLVEHAGEWRWSSARAHLGKDKTYMLDLVRWRRQFDATRWEQWLCNDLATITLAERIREATHSGFPLGDREFHDDLRTRFGLQTEPRKPGRRSKLSIPIVNQTERGILLNV